MCWLRSIEATSTPFDQACRIKAINLASRIGLRTQLNINFLPNAVYEPLACIRATLAAAENAAFPPSRLTFEIVEGEDLAEAGHLRRIIETYRRIGFRVDLGRFRKRLFRADPPRRSPPRQRQDRPFPGGQDADHDQMRLAILRNILNLGREIGTTVVLEGVERLEEVESLRAIGGRFMQGSLLCPPDVRRRWCPTTASVGRAPSKLPPVNSGG